MRGYSAVHRTDVFECVFSNDPHGYTVGMNVPMATLWV